jgi:hypothetical protein
VIKIIPFKASLSKTGLAPYLEESDFDADFKWSQHNVMVYLGFYLKYKKKKDNKTVLK